MSRFNLQVKKWADRVSVDIKVFTRSVAFQLHDLILEETPVDTGRARASWTIIAGEVADTSVAPETFAGGAAAATAYAKSNQGAVALANSYVIANNLPYIERLENGHSNKKPAGMVAVSIAFLKLKLEQTHGQ